MGSLQQHSVLKGWLTGQEKMVQLHEVFHKMVTQHSNAVAVRFDDADGEERTLSYAQLDDLSARLAKVFRKYGSEANNVEPAIVSICLRPSERLPVVLLAVLKAGMAYLPMDVEYPMSRVKHVLQDAKPLLVVVENEADTSIYEETLSKTYDELLEEAQQENSGVTAIDEKTQQLAIVLYTSGSTGIPKGVLLSHATILNRLCWQWRELPYASDEERCIFKTALTFVDSVSEIWAPLLQGRTLVVVPRDVTKDPERFVRLLQRHKIQRLVLVPSLLHSLLMYLSLEGNRDILPYLKLWICSGEILPISLANKFFVTLGANDRTLANFYGSTEIMGDVSYYLLRHSNDLQMMEKVPIGKPVDNCIIYLVDKDMRFVPQGEIGEILVAGRNLALGYLHDKDSHRFLDNPYAVDPEYSRVFRTGDYGRIVKGSIIYEGRVDSQVKIRGHRVDLAEVEKILLQAPGVDKAVVLCYKPGEMSQELVAFVTTKNEGLSDGCCNKIQDFLENMVPPYMRPHLVMLDRIPLLTNGKTDRQKLLRQYEASLLADENRKEVDYDYSGISEQDVTKAKVLFSTISSVIGGSVRVPINLNANFYELGGNSLNSIYAVTMLREQGYHIGITEFITAKNLADVLCRMKSEEDSSSSSSSLWEMIDEEKRLFEMLNHSHKSVATEIITESFYTKADLEQWLMPGITRDDYRELMNSLWNPLIEKDLSFVLRSSQNGKLVGVALNFDVWDEPEVVTSSQLSVVFDFLEYLEKPLREEKLPKGKGQLLHSFIMATHSELSPAENVIVMKEMEEHCLRLAKRKGYIGIFTTNTSPLTQQLGTNVYGYETLLAYRVNEYVTADGWKPFGKAPNSQVAVCSFKMID